MRARFLAFLLIYPLLGADLSPAQSQTTTAPTVAAPNPAAPTATAPTAPVATAEAVQEAFVRVAAKLRASVVTIICETAGKAPARPGAKTAPPEDEDGDEIAPFSDPSEPSLSLGTGVVIQADGYILTNNHVVRDADVIRVLFNADSENPDRAVARVVGYDEESDLAVLKIARTDLSVATFADSDAVRIGQWALAMGAPFDQPQTFTAGVISAKGRHLNKNNTTGLQDYLQTDASINPGNSGGPLVNLDGEVIGINTAILSPSRYNIGIGFSVPSNSVKRLLPILMSGKSVKRGFLGIRYVRLDDAVAKEFGVAGGMQIGGLAKKDGNYIGPAKEAGLRESDIITAVDDTPITSREQFRALVASAEPGRVLKFAVTRPGAETPTRFETPVTLGDFSLLDDAPKVVPAIVTKKTLGLGLETKDALRLSAAEKDKFGLRGNEKGAVITTVAPGSAADEGDLARGLRIVRARVEGVWQLTPDSASWQKIEKNAPPSAHILLQLRDKDETSVYKLVIVPAKTEPTIAADTIVG